VGAVVSWSRRCLPSRGRFFLRFALTGQLLQAVTTGRQVGLLHHQHGEAILDLEAQTAALAHQAVALQQQTRSARVHRAAEDVEKLLADHTRGPYGSSAPAPARASGSGAWMSRSASRRAGGPPFV